MHQIEEYALLAVLSNQRNLPMKALSSASTKNNEWRCPIIILLVFVKGIFLKAEDCIWVFKNGLIFKLFFFEQDALVLNDRCSSVPKDKK